ncbi:glycosyltransferase family 2 protein [Paenibacillus harenae]|uniref:glycosyltransferase family 2 protein n=1 Tax=Paenibacillus harenae TaxID=306543 RepID=UPI00048D07C6|nr:glycosyltransferase family 2 protein [Paenibacillus harenae]
MKPMILTIVVPCYNEEEVLVDTFRQLREVLNELMKENLVAPESKILFVDDGSKDRTWSMISTENAKHPYVTGLKLARNVGHQKALLAGLEAACAKSDCVVSIDADLQDDIKVIRDFVLLYHEGFDIVYGVRAARKTDTWFKRNTANAYYRLMTRLGVRLVPNHADFRLMSKRAIMELSRYDESNLFLRGIVPLIGYPSAKVYYDRKERLAGSSKYNLRKMLSFAMDGIASFSVAPVRMVTCLGFGLLLVSIAAGFYTLIQKWNGDTHAGWTSIMLSIWFLGGLQLLGMGIMGEYIGKIFIEVKRRPKYAVELDLYSRAFQSDKEASPRLLPLRSPRPVK